jgi:hypothetical protein
MSTLAPAMLSELARTWETYYKSAALSGIVGDTAHKARGGYHISREDQPKTNYSVIRPDDKPGNGPNDRAAAIDMTLSTADIIKCHTQLRNFWKANDPRLKYINAWNGWDGAGDAGRYDVVKHTIETASSDHKWHIHLEIRRKYVNDTTAQKAILSLLRGESLASFQGKDDDEVTPEDIKAVAAATVDALLAKSVTKPDGKTVTIGALYSWSDAMHVGTRTEVGAKVDAVAKQVSTLSSKDLVDEAAIATALASNTGFVDALSAKVAAQLPTGVEVTPAQLSDAIKTALREGVAE